MIRAFRQAVVCHSAEDARFAGELGGFLTRNCPVEISYEPTAGDLLSAIERAMADLVFVVLSPSSVPRSGVWKREQWERVLLETPREFGAEMVFLLAADCRFPERLRRNNFLDCSIDRIGGFRALKRRLLESHADRARPMELPENRVPELAPAIIERLSQALADVPGVEEGIAPEKALAFARASTRDFEGVFWVCCGSRGQPGVLGDTAQALGLRLAGTLESNCEALREFCERRRCLFIFAGLERAHRDLILFGGKASIIFTVDFERPQRSPAELFRLFAAWPRALGECIRALGDARQCLRGILDYNVAVEFATAMVGMLKHLDRLAEADEILEIMAEAARRQGDPFQAHRLAWERSWIAEHWGIQLPELPFAANMPPPAQLKLF